MIDTASPSVRYSTSFQLAPGESDVTGIRVSPSLLTPYLKGEIMCSSRRFVYKVPNTVLGVIPLGADERAIPLQSIASVGTGSKFFLGRLILGLVLAIGGVSSFGGNGALGFFLVLLGVVFLAMSFPGQLIVTNSAGAQTVITVSILEKQKLQQFATEAQTRVFADLDQTRHDEAQSIRMMQAQLQQMQVQQMQQQAQQRSQE